MTRLTLNSANANASAVLAWLRFSELWTATNLHELDDATASAPAYDAAAEYDSWLPDPVAAELAAWAARHRPAVP